MSVRFWRVADGSPLMTVTDGHVNSTGQTTVVNAVTFAPDGQTVASAGGDGNARLWRVSDGAALAALAGHTDQVLAVSFAPDGQTLASGSADMSVRFWRVPDGSPVNTLVTKSPVADLAYSPSGELLATARFGDNIVDLWRVADGQLLASLSGPLGPVTRVKCSPDGSSWHRHPRTGRYASGRSAESRDRGGHRHWHVGHLVREAADGGTAMVRDVPNQRFLLILIIVTVTGVGMAFLAFVAATAWWGFTHPVNQATGLGVPGLAAVMSTPRASHTATALPDGRVLVVGAETTRAPTSAELFDPRAEGWTGATPPRVPRSTHRATLLADGRVLVTGGLPAAPREGEQATYPPSRPLAAVELFDPTSNQWTMRAPMNTPRRSHTATLLPDGSVLVVDGSADDNTGSGRSLATAERYDPARGYLDVSRIARRATNRPHGDVAPRWARARDRRALAAGAVARRSQWPADLLRLVGAV